MVTVLASSFLQERFNGLDCFLAGIVLVVSTSLSVVIY